MNFPSGLRCEWWHMADQLSLMHRECRVLHPSTNFCRNQQIVSELKNDWCTQEKMFKDRVNHNFGKTVFMNACHCLWMTKSWRVSQCCWAKPSLWSEMSVIFSTVLWATDQISVSQLGFLCNCCWHCFAVHLEQPNELLLWQNWFHQLEFRQVLFCFSVIVWFHDLVRSKQTRQMKVFMNPSECLCETIDWAMPCWLNQEINAQISWMPLTTLLPTSTPPSSESAKRKGKASWTFAFHVDSRRWLKFLVNIKLLQTVVCESANKQLATQTHPNTHSTPGLQLQPAHDWCCFDEEVDLLGL